MELKSANLLKRSRNRSTLSTLGGVNWQFRRITLTSSKILYGPVDGPSKDFFTIGSGTMCQAVAIDDKEFAFKVSTGNDELILCAANESNRDDWINSIREAANQPVISASNVEAVMDLAAEMDRIRIEKERVAKEEADKILQMNREKELERELAQKKLVADLAEKRRKEAAALLKKEQETVALRTSLSKMVGTPVACEKKLSGETAYKPRFIWIIESTKEFHWGKTADDFSNGKSKCIQIPNHMKSVRVNPDNATPNFSIELVDASELPESVYTKSVFNTTAPTSIDITFTQGSKTIQDAFIFVLNNSMKKS